MEISFLRENLFIIFPDFVTVPRARIRRVHQPTIPRDNAQYKENEHHIGRITYIEIKEFHLHKKQFFLLTKQEGKSPLYREEFLMLKK